MIGRRLRPALSDACSRLLALASVLSATSSISTPLRRCSVDFVVVRSSSCSTAIETRVRLEEYRRDRPHALRPCIDPGHGLPRYSTRSDRVRSIGRLAGPRGSLRVGPRFPSSAGSRTSCFESAAAGNGRRRCDRRRAGSLAVALLAYEEAVHLYEMALRRSGWTPPPAPTALSLLWPSATPEPRWGRPGAKSTLLRVADLGARRAGYPRCSPRGRRLRRRSSGNTP